MEYKEKHFINYDMEDIKEIIQSDIENCYNCEIKIINLKKKEKTKSINTSIYDVDIIKVLNGFEVEFEFID